MTLLYIKKSEYFSEIEPNILNQWHMGGKERADVMRTSRYCWVVGTKALAQSVKGTQSNICRATSVSDRWLHSPSSTHHLHVYKIKSMFFRVFLPFFFWEQNVNCSSSRRPFCVMSEDITSYPDSQAKWIAAAHHCREATAVTTYSSLSSRAVIAAQPGGRVLEW